MPIASRRRRARVSSSHAVISWPAKRTDPVVARSSPASTISSEVLPDPDGPISPAASPTAMSRSIPRRMLTGPAAEGTVSARPRTATSGGAGDGGVASMAAAYGLPGRLRKAVATLPALGLALGLALGVAAVQLAVPAMAGPVRLLVLGDSLTAG